MTRTHLRRGLAAAVLPLALGVLAGCGGDDSSADDAGSGSGADTGATASGDTAEGLEEGAEVSKEDFLATFRQAYENATTAQITMELGGATAMTAEGEADYETDPPSMEMTMTGDAIGGDVDVRLVDGTMYMKAPGMGDKFLAFDLDDPDNPLGSSLSDQMDPIQQFSKLEDGITGVTYVGEEEVDGDPTDHYSVTVDSAAMLDEMDPSLKDQASKSMPKELTYDMWFDEDGLYRQMEVDLGSTGGAVTMTFSDWGEDVDIEAPPTSQTTSLPGQ